MISRFAGGLALTYLGCSAAAANPVAYTCEGVDMPVIAHFAGGNTAHVDITWLGQDWTLPQVRSGSGAKYQSDLAQFWIKGDAATLTLADGSAFACNVAPRDP